MTRKGRRLATIAVVLAVLGGAVGLVLYGLSSSITFFNSPSDVVARQPPAGQRFRLGGLVAEGSVERLGDQVVTFAVTDGQNAVRVRYRGLLPDLFRERQGVVTEGRLGPDAVFVADSVLAKHDEAYMPREVADALRRAGHFRPEGAAATGPGAAGGGT